MIEHLKTQNQQNIAHLLLSNCSSSMSRKVKKKAERVKKTNLSTSMNPFNGQDKFNLMSESTLCDMKQAPTLPKSKPRSKNKRKEGPSNHATQDYSTLSENKMTKRYNSRSKLAQSKQKRNEEKPFVLNTQNSESGT